MSVVVTQNMKLYYTSGIGKAIWEVRWQGGSHVHTHASALARDEIRFCLGVLNADSFSFVLFSNLLIECVSLCGPLFLLTQSQFEMSIFVNSEAVLFSLSALATFSLVHPGFVECLLPSRLDLLNAGHGINGSLHELTIVSDGNVATLLEFEGRVVCHFLAACLTEGLGPADLAWIALHLEVFMAFGFAEAKAFGIVADKHDAVAWIAGRTAEVASVGGLIVYVSRRSNQVEDGHSTHLRTRMVAKTGRTRKRVSVRSRCGVEAT